MKKAKATTTFNINIKTEPLIEGNNSFQLPIEYNSSIPYSNPINNEVNNTWDFSKITIEKLGKELESTINSRTPFLICFKERQNNKISLDNEKQKLIIDKINNLRIISDAFCRLQADAIFSQNFIDNLVENKIMEAEHFFEISRSEQRKNLKILDVDTTLYGNLITHDVLKQEETRAEIRRKNALASQEEEKTKESGKKNEIIDKILNGADFNNLTIQQTYILTTFLNTNANQFSEFDLREKMKDFLIQSVKAEADKKSHEANGTKADVDLKYMKNEQIKKDAGL